MSSSFRRALAILVASSSIAACTTTATVPPATAPESTAEPVATAAPAGTEAPHSPAPDAGAACAGHVDSPPPGLVALEEEPPSFAIGQPGKGALCEGKVFTAKAPVTVYRVFSADYQTSKQAGPLGAYWTFEKPKGPLAGYRSTYEICPEWNDLDTLNECTIDVGAKVILGPGQSAACDGGKEYAKSPANQVLVVKVDGKVPVGNCKQSPVTWAE